MDKKTAASLAVRRRENQNKARACMARGRLSAQIVRDCSRYFRGETP